MIDINITLLIQCVNFVVSLFLINILIVSPIRAVLRQRAEEVLSLSVEIEELSSRASLLSKKYEQAMSEVSIAGEREKKKRVSVATNTAEVYIQKTKTQVEQMNAERMKELIKQCETVYEEIAPSIETFAGMFVKKVVQ